MNPRLPHRIFTAIIATSAVGFISGCASPRIPDESNVSAAGETARSTVRRYIRGIHNDEPYQEFKRLLRDSNWQAAMQYYVLDGVPEVVLEQMRSGEYFKLNLPFIDGVDNAVVYRPFPPHGTLRGPLAFGRPGGSEYGLDGKGTHIVEAFFLIDGVDPKASAGGLDVGSVYHVRFVLTRRGFQFLP